MKKEALIFLLTMPLVAAQSINIAGRQFSLLFIAPLVIIFLLIIFFIGLYIKDNFSKLKLPKLNLTKKKITKKIKELPEIDYHKEALKFEKRSRNLSKTEKLQQVSGLIKEYFYDILEIRKEVTHEELVDELKKKKPSLAPLAQKIVEYKYSGKGYTDQDINQLTKEFIDMTTEKKHIRIEKPLTKIEKFKKILIGKTKKEQSKNIFQIIKEKIKPIKENQKKTKKEIRKLKIKINREKPKILNQLNPIINSFKKNKLKKIIKKAKKTLNNIPEARKLYSKATSLYYQLPLEQEKELSVSLVDLYTKIEQAKLNEESRRLELLTQQINNITEKGGIITKEEKNYLKKIKIALPLISHYHKKWLSNLYKNTLQHIKKVEYKWAHNLHHTEKNLAETIKKDLEKLKETKAEISDKELITKEPKIKHQLLDIRNSLKKLEQNYEKRKEEKFKIKLNKKERLEIKELKYPTVKELATLTQIKNTLESIRENIKLSPYRLEKNERKLIYEIRDIIKEIKIKTRKNLCLLHKTEINLLNNIQKIVQPKLLSPHRIDLPQKSQQIHFTKSLNNLTKIFKHVENHGSHNLIEQEPHITNSLKEIIETAKEHNIPKPFRLISLDELTTQKTLRLSKTEKTLALQEKKLFNKMVNLENIRRQHQMEDFLKKIKKPQIEIHEFDLLKMPKITSQKTKQLNKQETDLFNKIQELDKKKLDEEKENIKESFHKVQLKKEPTYGWLNKVAELRRKKTNEFKKLAKEEKKLFNEIDKLAISS